MKKLFTAILCLVAGSVAAQEVACIGSLKEGLEANHLSDYEVVTKDYRQGWVISPNAFCDYYDPNGTWRDKNLTLEFNEKDICIRAINICQYDDLKQMIQYMNDHFTRLDDLHWKSVDNAFLFTMVVMPRANAIQVETVAMPKPVVKKATPKRK